LERGRVFERGLAPTLAVALPFFEAIALSTDEVFQDRGKVF